MASKSVKLFCFSCDVEYTVKVSDEVAKLEPEFCPFCGEEVDQDDGDVPEDDDEDSEY